MRDESKKLLGTGNRVLRPARASNRFEAGKGAFSFNGCGFVLGRAITGQAASFRQTPRTVAAVTGLLVGLAAIAGPVYRRSACDEMEQ